MKVSKFGGSTIKNARMIKKVGHIIKDDCDGRVVVVSALYGQTNQIREYIKEIKNNNHNVEGFIKKLRTTHEKIGKQTITNKKIFDDVFSEVERRIEKLERLLFGVAMTEELTPRTADLILSSTERMSAHIIEGVLSCSGVSAKAYEADQIGIITDGVFINATADLGKTSENLCKIIIPEIEDGTVPVITGFFGCDAEGRTTTFGKNGSDYSAAVIANALNADSLELWKDVDGFMSADPTVIKTAHTIDSLSYDEAAELAYFGIGILHPRTVGPVKQKNIPIVIKNILKPEGNGTTIIKKGYKAKKVIKSVVHTTDLVELKISGAGAGIRSGVLSTVSNALFKSNINIYSVSTSQTHLSLLIHKNDFKKCIKTIDKIFGGVIEDISFQKDIALICVVGEGARNKIGLAGKIFSAVSSAGVNVEIISAGASQVASHFIVKKSDFKKAVKAIHSEFCDN
jgi:aspartate kinase